MSVGYFGIGDVLGLAVADKVILTAEPAGGLRQNIVKVRDAGTGKWVAVSRKAIMPRYEYSCQYDLVAADAELILPFGELIQTDYFLTGANIQMSGGAWCRVVVNFMKMSAAAKFNAANSAAFSFTVPAGYGVASLLGCTVAAGGEAIDGSVNITVKRTGDNVPTATSGDYQDGAVVICEGLLTKSLTATKAITLPVGAKQISGDTRPGGDGEKLFAVSWEEDPTYA